MKKTILFSVILALLIPAAALAQTEFSLGGFIKLDSFWDSSQIGKNNPGIDQRNNNNDFQHGRLHFTAQGSRFNFTIKGPKLWGAQTTGFIEVDFDCGGGTDQVLNASNNYTPRLRHAMFRLNWPETELLMGQYWSMFCEYYPDTTEDGPFQMKGQATARLAQIRLTQKFAGDWTVAGLIGEPTTISSVPTAAAVGETIPGALSGNVLANHTLNTNGQSAESPQVQGKIQYQHDWWGQAAFFGRPMPFTAQITAGWQRNEARNANQALNGGLATFGQTFGQNGFVLQNIRQRDHQYLNPWMLQGNLFLPILPTYSKNLAGTASLSGQLYVGQGLEAFGEDNGQGNSFFRFRGISGFPGGPGLTAAGAATPAAAAVAEYYDLELTKKYGGYVQGQYYFNNEWFMNVVWGFSRVFGIPEGRNSNLATANNNLAGLGAAGISPGYVYASLLDQYKMNQEIAATLWFRPITAIKFGLQYAYSRTDWLQKLPSPSAQWTSSSILPISSGNNVKDVGESHRIQFVGFFYF